MSTPHTQRYVFPNKSIIPSIKKWRCNLTTSSVPGGSIVCDPPSYNSIAYTLLGYVLLGLSNAATWDAFDFKNATLPPSLRAASAKGRYDGLVFFKKGRCADYPKIAHYYNFQYRESGESCYARAGIGDKCGYADQYNTSCLNGWAFGNVGASALAAATFFYDLVGRTPRIVSGESALEMQQWNGVLAGHHWEKYGLGLMWLPLERYGELNTSVPGTEPISYAVGHNGADYGSYTHNAYHPSLDVATSFMINKDIGIWSNNGTLLRHPEAVFCMGYRAVFRLLGKGALGNSSFVCDDRSW